MLYPINISWQYIAGFRINDKLINVDHLVLILKSMFSCIFGVLLSWWLKLESLPYKPKCQWRRIHCSYDAACCHFNFWRRLRFAAKLPVKNLHRTNSNLWSPLLSWISANSSKLQRANSSKYSPEFGLRMPGFDKFLLNCRRTLANLRRTQANFFVSAQARSEWEFAGCSALLHVWFLTVWNWLCCSCTLYSHGRNILFFPS